MGARTAVEEVRFTLVLTGTYRIVALSAEGARVTLRSIGPGGYFGEVGILAKKAPGNWAAIPDKAGDVLSMSHADFAEVLDRVPRLRSELLHDVASQAAKWAERIFELAILSPRARLLSELLRLADLHEGDGPQVMLCSAPTHDTLASEIGITREAVSRHLKSLRTEGLIISSRREITLTDLPRLRALVKAEID
ncbi:Crp/Fnr family transcriptional regulator [Bradyrhizobium liaoningense]